MQNLSDHASREWRSHWPLPVISAIGLAVAFSYVYTTGIFIGPIQHDLGWSRTMVSSGLTIISVISVILAPYIGKLIDRIGARRVALPGLFLYCLASAALGLAGRSVAMWLVLWSLVGLGSVFIKPTVWGAAIAMRFDRGRGLAMSVALCGSGIGGMILPLLSTLLIDAVGWREALALLAVGEALISIPIVYFFFDRAYSPNATAACGTANDLAARQTSSLSFGEALHDATFLRLAVATLVITVALLALSVHLVPILTARGMAVRTASFCAGLVGVAMIVGRIGTGFLLDRFSGTRIGTVVFLLPTLVCLLLLYGGSSPFSAIAAALLLGLSLGSEVDVVMYLASRYFGLQNFGAIYGTLNGLTSLGTGLGPLLGAYVYDQAGTYVPLFWALIPMYLLAACLIGTLGSYARAGRRDQHRV